jgi:hypothetical protein
VCLHIEEELRELDAQVVGSLTDAEAQRLIHRTLHDAVKWADRNGTFDEYEMALARWNGHLAEHREQAAVIRAGRQK